MFQASLQSEISWHTKMLHWTILRQLLCQLFRGLQILSYLKHDFQPIRNVQTNEYISWSHQLQSILDTILIITLSNKTRQLQKIKYIIFFYRKWKSTCCSSLLSLWSKVRSLQVSSLQPIVRLLHTGNRAWHGSEWQLMRNNQYAVWRVLTWSRWSKLTMKRNGWILLSPSMENPRALIISIVNWITTIII